MQCPKCQAEQPEGGEICARCGLVFAKHRPEALRRPRRPRATPRGPEGREDGDAGWIETLKGLALARPQRVTRIAFVGRCLVYGVLFTWGWVFILSPMDRNYAGESFLHLVNLPFHEFGHILFMPLGDFLRTLGGSLTQLLIPLVCLAVFLVKTKDAFAASVALWWLGESSMDLAPYIGDARARELVLLGGVTGREVEGYHDWEAILGTLGLLEYDQFFAGLAQAAGIGAMVLSFAWGGWMLRLQVGSLAQPGER